MTAVWQAGNLSKQFFKNQTMNMQSLHKKARTARTLRVSTSCTCVQTACGGLQLSTLPHLCQVARQSLAAASQLSYDRRKVAKNALLFSHNQRGSPCRCVTDRLQDMLTPHLKGMMYTRPTEHLSAHTCSVQTNSQGVRKGSTVQTHSFSERVHNHYVLEQARNGLPVSQGTRWNWCQSAQPHGLAGATLACSSIQHTRLNGGRTCFSTRSSSFPATPQVEQDQSSRTIVITSGKGGVGKTTTTANLGMSIARLGYRVALIDADIGLRNLDLLLGLENRVLYTAMDIFEGECRLDQALIRDKRLKNLCLLAISKNRQRYNVTRQKMDHLVGSISSLGYHFILIDCPAGIDVGFINAISPAQEALIVTTPEITAMRDADRVAGLLEANGIYNAKLLINRVRPDMIQRHDMMSVQDVQDVLGIPLLGAIPEDIDVIISTNRGEPLVLRKKLTLSGIAFENAARRLIGKQDYLIDLKTPYKGIFQKIQTLFLP